ncbi:MAG: ArsB/NhaD family transporter [Thermoprotei archaeon]
MLVKEIYHRVVAAGIIASITLLVLILLGKHNYVEVLEGIDIDTILLLMAMMTMVSIMARSGIFSYIAIEIIKKTYNKPYLLLVLFGVITGAISAFIDNVTTVVIVTPIIINIARELRVDPRPLLITIVLMSNIGGTATLIGDPPNILIGTAADLGFNDFILNLGPIVVIDSILTLLLLKLIYRKYLRSWKERAKFISTHTIELDKNLAVKSIISFTITIILFFLEDIIGYPPAIPAVIGAGLLLAMSGRTISLHTVLEGIEWSTLVFFIFMFIIIKGIEVLGVIKYIADTISSLSISVDLIVIVIVWVSAILSAFIDNIPFVMAMIPVIKHLNTALNINTPILYWALSLGGCLGGNGTLIGASANVVVASISEKYGYYISFNSFTKVGLPIMLITVGTATLYLLLCY